MRAIRSRTLNALKLTFICGKKSGEAGIRLLKVDSAKADPEQVPVHPEFMLKFSIESQAFVLRRQPILEV